jgi:hypothetical protein
VAWWCAPRTTRPARPSAAGSELAVA